VGHAVGHAAQGYDTPSTQAYDTPSTQAYDSPLYDGQPQLVGLDARNISAWFGGHKVLDRVSLHMEPGKVTALIGPRAAASRPSCGSSTACTR